MEELAATPGSVMPQMIQMGMNITGLVAVGVAALFSYRDLRRLST
jgi:hypothetical protein